VLDAQAAGLRTLATVHNPAMLLSDPDIPKKTNFEKREIHGLQRLPDGDINRTAHLVHAEVHGVRHIVRRKRHDGPEEVA
jgi:hypothetical protein